MWLFIHAGVLHVGHLSLCTGLLSTWNDFYSSIITSIITSGIHPFPKFNDALWQWIGNFILHLSWNVIIYPCWDPTTWASYEVGVCCEVRCQAITWTNDDVTSHNELTDGQCHVGNTTRRMMNLCMVAVTWPLWTMDRDAYYVIIIQSWF